MTPVLDPGVDHVVGYFPAGLWYDYFTVRCTIASSTFCLIRVGSVFAVCGHIFFTLSQGDSVCSKGEELRLHAPLDKINLHLREGSITPTQVPEVSSCGSFFLVVSTRLSGSRLWGHQSQQQSADIPLSSCLLQHSQVDTKMFLGPSQEA